MAVPNIDDVFPQFAEMLEKRFSKRVFTTEDDVRYAFFQCLTTRWDIDPSDIVLEYPHPGISGAKVDTYVMPKNGQPSVAFEFKFDRRIPSGKNLPRPQKAGKIFADIFRLALLKPEDNVRLFFVYVTDDEMAAYLQNPSNQLADFFDMTLGQHLVVNKQYVGKHSTTLVNAAGSKTCGCELVCHLNREFHSGFWLRIYEVQPTACLKT
jgi:hypothetical protein